MSDFGSTVYKNKRRDFIQTVNLPRIKAREGPEDVRIKNFNFGMK